jgi:hypothetical protein
MLKIKNPNQVLYDNTVKMYGNQPCDIKYEILVKEKIILFFNHGDLVDSKYLKSFEKSDTQIKFSFLWFPFVLFLVLMNVQIHKALQVYQLAHLSSLLL